MTPDRIPAAKAKTGRPRGFDRDLVLTQVATLFGRHGYEGLSVADLALELGLSHPSLYAAFGAKPVLYRMALDDYAARWVSNARSALAAGGLDAALAAFFVQQVEAFQGDGDPCGCMLSSALLTSGEDHREEARHASALRRLMIRTVRERLDRAVLNRELPVGTDTRSLAACVCGMVHGLSTLARDGASHRVLSDFAALGLAGLSFRMRASEPRVSEAA